MATGFDLIALMIRQDDVDSSTDTATGDEITPRGSLNSERYKGVTVLTVSSYAGGRYDWASGEDLPMSLAEKIHHKRCGWEM